MVLQPKDKENIFIFSHHLYWAGKISAKLSSLAAYSLIMVRRLVIDVLASVTLQAYFKVINHRMFSSYRPTRQYKLVVSG